MLAQRNDEYRGIQVSCMNDKNFAAGPGKADPSSPVSGSLSPSAGPLDQLIAQIRDQDDIIRGAAWQNAGSYGAVAIKPLAGLMSDPALEISRAAKRGLWKIVRHAGRPGADKEKRAVVSELLALLDGTPLHVRREVLWMLSEIGSDATVKPVAILLSDRELREDARVALERIPGSRSLAALKESLHTVSEDFRPAIAQSLRVRGVKVTEYPNQKTIPARPNGAAAPNEKVSPAVP